jgi:hypothetical protein
MQRANNRPKMLVMFVISFVNAVVTYIEAMGLGD